MKKLISSLLQWTQCIQVLHMVTCLFSCKQSILITYRNTTHTLWVYNCYSDFNFFIVKNNQIILTCFDNYNGVKKLRIFLSLKFSKTILLLSGLYFLFSLWIFFCMKHVMPQTFKVRIQNTVVFNFWWSVYMTFE